METRAMRRRWFKTVATELAQLEEGAFLAQHPEPALILEPTGLARVGGINTPEQGTPISSLESTISDVVTAPQTFSKPTDVVHPDARVVWLVKSERNPFAGMITVGRANNNDVILPHSAISKMHAIFYPLMDLWSVEDRTSTNGTFVDGVRLPDREKREVNDGSILRFGDVVSARFFAPHSFYRFCCLVSGTGEA